jgi:hypothetical protein
MAESAIMNCEACGNSLAARGDVLCLGCSRTYHILSRLLLENPGLTDIELVRMKSVFEWRARKQQQWLQSLFGAQKETKLVD